MVPTVAAVPGYTREDRLAVARWLGEHLKEARRLARGVTPEQAASGMDPNPSTGALQVPAMRISGRTIRRLEDSAEKKEDYAPQEAQILAAEQWVRQYLGYGPEACRERPCRICAPKRSAQATPAPRRGVEARPSRK